MSRPYNQLKAMLAITRASLRAAFRSPQGVFFSLFFPIVLIIIFGSLGGGGNPSVDVAFEKNTDTTSALYHILKDSISSLDFEDSKKVDIEEQLRKGRITAIIGIAPKADSSYQVHLRMTSASVRDYPLLSSILRTFIYERYYNANTTAHPEIKPIASISQSVTEVRKYDRIDFLLPGMIGFSLIGAAIFGIAFSFYSLKETLVLKRLYSTPIRKPFIVLGEGIARVLFQLTTVVVLIAFGYFVYHFTLAHGFITFLEMLVLSFLGLIVFMGFGFVISGVARNQNVIPIYANLFMFPQYFLSGTFFPKSALPSGLQAVINYLPLTAFNDAMRNVAFEGSSLFSCWKEISILVVWGIIVYAVAIKVFKWE
jgi:ABC-2 type transport system permease protein